MLLGSPWRRAGARLALTGSFVVLASTARAQSTETPAARADRLFHEGKVALEAGRYEEACPKLAESQKLDPGTGTLLALGLCHESEGKTASAWHELYDVVEASQRSGRADRAALARKHLSALEPKLSKLAIVVADASARDRVHVRRDGEDVPFASWGQAVPVDPGDHLIEASAAGAAPWKATVHVGGDGDAKVVEVPKLGGSPVSATPSASAAPPPVASPPPAPPAQEDATAPRSDRTLAWIVGGAGVVVLGLGAYFGVRALGNRSDATSLCPGSPCTNAQGVSDNDSAKTDAWVADVAVPIGLAGVAAGLYLLLRPEDSGQSRAARVVPLAGPGVAGIGVSSRW